jgi:hypothetical protein
LRIRQLFSNQQSFEAGWQACSRLQWSAAAHAQPHRPSDSIHHKPNLGCAAAASIVTALFIGVSDGWRKGGSSSLPPSWREVEWDARESLSSFYPILRILRVPQKVHFPTPFSVPWHCCCVVIIRSSSTTNRDPDLHLRTRDHFQLLFTLKQSPRVHFRSPDTTVSVSHLISCRILI